MFRNHTLWPETVNILGGTQQTYHQRTAVQYSEAQEESTSKKTWWGRFKDKAKKALDKFKENVIFVKEYVAPILTAAASILTAWGAFKRSTDNGRYTTCAA